jgi:hypothetical protein
MKIRFLSTSKFCLKFKIMVEFEIEIIKKRKQKWDQNASGPYFPAWPKTKSHLTGPSAPLSFSLSHLRVGPLLQVGLQPHGLCPKSQLGADLHAGDQGGCCWLNLRMGGWNLVPSHVYLTRAPLVLLSPKQNQGAPWSAAGEIGRCRQPAFSSTGEPWTPPSP